MHLIETGLAVAAVVLVAIAGAGPSFVYFRPYRRAAGAGRAACSAAACPRG